MLLYLIENKITGQLYLGITAKTLAQRWGEHKRARNDGTYFHNAIRKHGPDAFTTTTVCYASSHDELCRAEQAAIAAFRAAGLPLYNLLDGGNGIQSGYRHAAAVRKNMGGSHKHTPESKAKISAANRGKTRTCDMGHFRGRKHSQETRKKMADAARRRWAYSVSK